jgi:hypothetical protein
MPNDSSQYGYGHPDGREHTVFGDTSQDRVQLDEKILKPAYRTTYETIWRKTIAEDGVEEWRPVYPEFGIEDVAVGNLMKPDKDGNPSLEEMAVRGLAEVAIGIQRRAELVCQEKDIEEKQVVKINEKPEQLLLYSGIAKGKIKMKRIGEDGTEFFEEVEVNEMPYFTIIETKFYEKIELFEEKTVKKKIRIFLDRSPTCRRFHEIIMNRIRTTQSRGMAGPELVHKFHTQSTTTAMPQEEPSGMFG